MNCLNSGSQTTVHEPPEVYAHCFNRFAEKNKSVLADIFCTNKIQSKFTKTNALFVLEK
jgi:hypothetical protein